MATLKALYYANICTLLKLYCMSPAWMQGILNLHIPDLSPGNGAKEVGHVLALRKKPAWERFRCQSMCSGRRVAFIAVKSELPEGTGVRDRLGLRTWNGQSALRGN